MTFATLRGVVHLYNCQSMKSDSDIRGLVLDAQAGNREAFEAIYRALASRIFNFLYRLQGSREEAEDLTQQTFLIALRQIKSLRDPSQLESWVYRIARNEVYQKFRRKKFDVPEENGSDSQDPTEPLENRLHANPERVLLNAELGRKLQTALGNLPLKLREVFILAVIQEKSYRDISAVVGRSLLSVKTDIYRARNAARAELGKYVENARGKKVNSSETSPS